MDNIWYDASPEVWGVYRDTPWAVTRLNQITPDMCREFLALSGVPDPEPGRVLADIGFSWEHKLYDFNPTRYVRLCDLTQFVCQNRDAIRSCRDLGLRDPVRLAIGGGLPGILRGSVFLGYDGAGWFRVDTPATAVSALVIRRNYPECFASVLSRYSAESKIVAYDSELFTEPPDAGVLFTVGRQLTDIERNSTHYACEELRLLDRCLGADGVLFTENRELMSFSKRCIGYGNSQDLGSASHG